MSDRMSSILFERLHPDFELELATDGDATHRLLIFRLANSNGREAWERVDGANILVIGGRAARAEMRRMVEELTRRKVESLIPGGIGARTYKNLRAYILS